MPTIQVMLDALQQAKTEDEFIDFIKQIYGPTNKTVCPYQKIWAREIFREYVPHCKKLDYPISVAFPRHSGKTWPPHYLAFNAEREMPMMQEYKPLPIYSHIDEFQFDPFVHGQRPFFINHPLYKSEMVPKTSGDYRFRGINYQLLSTALKCARMQFSERFLCPSEMFLCTFAYAECAKGIYQQLLEKTSLLKISEDSFTGPTRRHRNIWKMKKEAIMK